MPVLALGLDSFTVRYLQERAITVDVVEYDSDFDLADWLTADGLFDAAVLNLDSGVGNFVCREIRARNILTPVLGLASPTEVSWPERRAIFLEQGGDDLLRAPVNPRELVASLRACFRRFTGSMTSVLTSYHQGLTLKMNLVNMMVTLDGVPVDLTSSEARVLALMFSGNAGNRVFSKEQFLANMYANPADEPEIKIVDVYICKIRNKLRDINPQAISFIETVWGRGYRLGGSPVQPNTMAVA